MHSCLLSSMITVEKKVHLNLKNINLQHGFSNDDMETRLPVELNIQMGKKTIERRPIVRKDPQN